MYFLLYFSPERKVPPPDRGQSGRKSSGTDDIVQYHVCFLIVFTNLLRRFQHIFSFALIAHGMIIFLRCSRISFVDLAFVLMILGQ